uniref:Uncharacterized protein n=1 Tax=Parastrongyloides trichosuri TaxID=131310 RepID=A0A0N4ZA90_PARTI
MRSNMKDSSNESPPPVPPVPPVPPGLNYTSPIPVQIPQHHGSSSYVPMPHMYGYTYVPGLTCTPPPSPIPIAQVPTHMIGTTYVLTGCCTAHKAVQDCGSAHPTESGPSENAEPAGPAENAEPAEHAELVEPAETEPAETYSSNESPPPVPPVPPVPPGLNYTSPIPVQIPQHHGSSSYVPMPHMYGYTYVPGLTCTPPPSPIPIAQVPTHMIGTTYVLTGCCTAHKAVQDYGSAHPTESGPSENAEPAGPAENAEPAEHAELVEPAETEPAETEPAEHAEPDVYAENAEPAEHAELDVYTGPAEPAETEPAEHAEADVYDENAEPAEHAELDVYTEPAEPSVSAEPDVYAEPAEHAELVEPVVSEQDPIRNEPSYALEPYHISEQEPEPPSSKYQSFWPPATYGSTNMVVRRHTPEPTEHAVLSNFISRPRTPGLSFIMNETNILYIGSPQNTYDFDYSGARFRYRTNIFNSVRQALNYHMVLHSHGESGAAKYLQNNDIPELVPNYRTDRWLEDEGFTVLKEIIIEKYRQNSGIRRFLKNESDKILVYCTLPDPVLGTGGTIKETKEWIAQRQPIYYSIPEPSNISLNNMDLTYRGFNIYGLVLMFARYEMFQNNML